VAYNLATPTASMVSLHGMKMLAFDTLWSMMVSIMSYPSEGGSFMMKSRAMVWNGNECAGVIGNMGGLVG
jgi:hypothetical protein